MVYKIITGKVKLNRDHFFTFAPNQTNRGSHEFKLMKKKATKDVRRNSFSTRVIDDWNNLPKSVVPAQSTNSFKKTLDNHWGIEDECATPF